MLFLKYFFVVFHTLSMVIFKSEHNLCVAQWVSGFFSRCKFFFFLFKLFRELKKSEYGIKTNADNSKSDRDFFHC